jgi:hypothetical protein
MPTQGQIQRLISGQLEDPPRLTYFERYSKLRPPPRLSEATHDQNAILSAKLNKNKAIN